MRRTSSPAGQTAAPRRSPAVSCRQGPKAAAVSCRQGGVGVAVPCKTASKPAAREDGAEERMGMDQSRELQRRASSACSEDMAAVAIFFLLCLSDWLVGSVLSVRTRTEPN